YYAPDPMETLLRPARRAGILMFVVSGLMLLCGVCVGMLGALPLDQMEMPPAVMAELSRAERETGMKRWVFFAIGGGIIAVPSLILLILGFFVRRGGAGSIITSIVLTGLLMLLMALNLLGAARSGSIELILPLGV